MLKLPILEREYLDFSILETHSRCPRLAMFNYVFNRAANTVNYPIQFGSAYHKFRETLEQLYLQWVRDEGTPFEKVDKKLIYESAFAVATRGWEDPPLEHKKSYLDLGRLSKTCKEAFERWVAEKTQGYYKVIATEASFTLPLPSGRLFAGRIDQVIEWNARLWIRDFKTAGRKPSGGNWQRYFSPNHQFTGYTWAQSELSNRQVQGVIVDVAYNIKSRGPEFYPTMASRTLGDVKFWLEWIEEEYDRYEMHMEKKRWPMNTSACNDYGGCFFTECCNRSDWSSIELWLKENTIHSEWDPLDPEKEEGLPQ
jgi:hypothetical protein